MRFSPHLRKVSQAKRALTRTVLARQYICGAIFVQYDMIVAKFGGTAVTPRNLIYLKRIVTPAYGAVVVSAVGSEFYGDVKVTDLLLEYFQSGDESVWQRIADKYLRLAEVNGVNADVQSLLAEVKNRARLRDAAYCSSVGEELSARIAAAYLDRNYVEAEETIRFDGNGKLLVAETYSNVRKAFARGCGVMGGFYGGASGGRATFGRGGGDVTGAVVAAALNASLYENWTDAKGVCVADPSKVHGVTTVAGMSYSEMRLLSLAGAEVLHPDAVSPCEQLSVPIRIGNFFHPDGASTLVSRCPSRSKLLSIAEKETDGVFVATVLHSYPTWQITSAVSDFIRTLTREQTALGRSYTPDPPIFRTEIDKRVVRIYSRQSVLNALYKRLSVL